MVVSEYKSIMMCEVARLTCYGTVVLGEGTLVLAVDPHLPLINSMQSSISWRTPSHLQY